jgi:hypothetical protein
MNIDQRSNLVWKNDIPEVYSAFFIVEVYEDESVTLNKLTP